MRDAILTPEGGEPEWPKADVVIGNPPFFGHRLMLKILGEDYTQKLRQTYEGLVPAFADLVCYWFSKAEWLIVAGRNARAGFVATNSVRGGKNRTVLDRIVGSSTLYEAWSDEPWVVEGAAVRVSIVCFAGQEAGLTPHLNGTPTGSIHADLTAGSMDLTRAVQQAENKSIAFAGSKKYGAFDIPGDLARTWLCLPANPKCKPNSDVLRPWINGMDVVRRPAGKWIIGFGSFHGESDSALYEAPFAHVAEHVKPTRMRGPRKTGQRTVVEA